MGFRWEEGRDILTAQELGGVVRPLPLNPRGVSLKKVSLGWGPAFFLCYCVPNKGERFG